MIKCTDCGHRRRAKLLDRLLSRGVDVSTCAAVTRSRVPMYSRTQELEVVPELCTRARETALMCGPDAKLFQPKVAAMRFTARK